MDKWEPVIDTTSYHRAKPAAEAPVRSTSISLGMTVVMAIACGVAVANMYYNQPMLGLMEAAFPGQLAATGFVPTATQLGFAVGLVLLVPLGDRVDRRRLILIQFVALALSLACVALAPGGWSLVIASVLVGVTATVAQQIVPFAAELAEPGRRGATIGTVMSGLLCGILFGRALAGVIGDHYGWRATFWLGMLLTVVMAVVLSLVLPRSHPKTQASYLALLKSLAVLWREEHDLRRASMIQACLFGSFSALWTILALQLDARYHLSAAIAGLFGIVGAVGVLFAPIRGEDRGPERTTCGDRAGMRHHAWFMDDLRSLGHDRGPCCRRYSSGLWRARRIGLKSECHLCASPGSAQSTEHDLHERDVCGRCCRLRRRQPCLGIRRLGRGMRFRALPGRHRPGASYLRPYQFENGRHNLYSPRIALAG
jgi:predicted MFS family arabinose efflux permease